MLAVGGTQCEQDLQVRAEAGVADRGGPDHERLRVLTQCAELLFSLGFRAWTPTGCRAWPVVVPRNTPR